MARKKKKKSNRPQTVAFGVLVALAVAATAFFLFTRADTGTSAAENAVGSVMAPVQNAVSVASNFVKDIVTGVKNYNQMSYQNEVYARQIQEMQIQIDALEEAAIENERLKDLLGVKEKNASQDPIYATVIGRNPGIWFDMFSINRGQMDGISVDMPVIVGDGLVGYVAEVGLNYAKVISIINADSGVSCMIQRTRDMGVMRGVQDPAAGLECNMYYVENSYNIVPGDKVLTSGTDRRYPKGITVGTVAAVSRQMDSADQYIVVTPAVDFFHIEEVLVLRTKVETDRDNLPSVPTPTPRPTPQATPTPIPTVDPDAADNGDEEANWTRPTPMPNAGVPDSDATPTPTPTQAPVYQVPEDEWALEP